MKKAGIQILFLSSMFLVALPIKLPLLPRRAPPPQLRPLCASQLTLVNYACGTMPLVPSPFLSSDTPDVGNGNGTETSQGDGNGTETRPGGERHNRHRHKHRHKHRHGHRHKEITPEQGYCCRWLKMVEIECVCDMLAHLPLFLSWPLHHYTVNVDEACSVTFTCGGRLRP